MQFGESHAAKLMPQPGLEICIKAAGRGGGDYGTCSLSGEK